MGRPTREDEPRVATGIRLPLALHERLLKEATARDVSFNWLVTRLLTEAIDDLLPIAELRITRKG